MCAHHEAVRAWAAQESAVAAVVRQVDKERLGILRELFFELGFRGAGLEMTTRTFVTYYSLEQSILVRQSKRDRMREARSRIEMLLLPLAGRSSDHARPAADQRAAAPPGS